MPINHTIYSMDTTQNYSSPTLKEVTLRASLAILDGSTNYQFNLPEENHQIG